MSSARTSPARAGSGAAQKAAQNSALNLGWVFVSVMGQACVLFSRSSITYEVMPDCDSADLSPGWNRVGVMALKAENTTIDTTDPEKLAEWWARALNGEVNAVAPPFFVVVAVPEGPGLAFQQVEDPTPGKNRIHVDFSTPD